MTLFRWILLLTLSLLWGASFYFTEKALMYHSFEQVTFLRVLFATLFIGLIVFIKKVKIYLTPKLFGLFILLGLFNNVLPFLGFTYAQESISSSLASMCNATTPIFTAILAHFFTQDEKLNIKTILGISIGFIGMFILIDPTGVDSFEYGVIIALVSAFSFGLAAILAKMLKDHDPLFVIFGMLSVSSLIMFILFFDSLLEFESLSYEPLIDIISLGVLSTAIAYILYFYLLFRVGAVRLLLVTYLVPISAILLGVFFLNEQITFQMILGIIFIFISLLVVNHERKIS